MTAMPLTTLEFDPHHESVNDLPGVNYDTRRAGHLMLVGGGLQVDDIEDASHDKEVLVNDRGISVLSPTIDHSEVAEEITTGFMKARLGFVRDVMHWVPQSTLSDADPYDADPNTTYLVKTADQDGSGDRSFVAGMRLTKVNSVEESMTWNMLRNRPDIQEEISAKHGEAIKSLDAIAENEALWDLTRLVSQVDGSVSPRECAAGVQEVFGAGVTMSTQNSENTKWLFLTTASFKRFLDVSGVVSEELYSGVITQGDKEESVMCLVDPAAAYEQLKMSENPVHKRTAEAVMRGAGVTLQ